MHFPLLTSIMPPRNAAELSYLRDCIASWRTAGFDPVAVNGISDIDTLRDLALPLDFVALPGDGRPRIGAILNATRASGLRFAGIINSDCRIFNYRSVASNLAAGLERRAAVAARCRGLPANGPAIWL
jgi:hypothetical protein